MKTNETQYIEKLIIQHNNVYHKITYDLNKWQVQPDENILLPLYIQDWKEQVLITYYGSRNHVTIMKRETAAWFHHYKTWKPGQLNKDKEEQMGYGKSKGHPCACEIKIHTIHDCTGRQHTVW